MLSAHDEDVSIFAIINRSRITTRTAAGYHLRRVVASCYWTRANIDDLPLRPPVIAREKRAWCHYLYVIFAIFILMYRAGALRKSNAVCAVAQMKRSWIHEEGAEKRGDSCNPTQEDTVDPVRREESFLRDQGETRKGSFLKITRRCRSASSRLKHSPRNRISFLAPYLANSL